MGPKILAKSISCCINCVDRDLGCHVTCSLYKKEKEALDRSNLIVRAKKEYENLYHPKTT